MIWINGCDDLLHGEMGDRYSPLNPLQIKRGERYSSGSTGSVVHAIKPGDWGDPSLLSLPIRYIFKMKVSISSAILLAMISTAYGRAVASDPASVDRRSAEGVKYRTYDCE